MSTSITDAMIREAYGVARRGMHRRTGVESSGLTRSLAEAARRRLGPRLGRS